MRDDDLDLIKKPKYQLGQDISAFSVEELAAIIVDLKAEIARVDHEMNAKRKQMGAANALFKS